MKQRKNVHDGNDSSTE